MKKYFATFVAGIILLAACKKEPPIDTTEPLAKRLPGTWQVTEIQYNGVAPNPLNQTQSIAFSGAGKNVSGYFHFDKDTNLGEFNISFIAEADLGLGAPLSYVANEKRGGVYDILDGDKIVRMTNFAADSVYNWEVRENKPNRQKWFVVMYHNWGVAGMDSIPINVEATMTR